MKTNTIKLICLLIMATTAVSCKKALEDTLSRDIPIKEKTISFTVKPDPQLKSAGIETRSTNADNVLYDGMLNVNIAKTLEDNGFSFENLKSFLLSKGTLELVTPDGYDMKDFNNVKLYFDNRSQLVAKAEKVEGSKVLLTVVNGQLLDRLKDDKLHIILTGQLPSETVSLKLIMDFTAKVSLIK